MNNASLGFSVRIFIPDGDPEGLRVMEKSNWTGQGLIFPRSIYPNIRGITELTRTGVYVLWSPDESTELPRVYVGQGNELRSRLNEHNSDKDFWTNCVAFTSKDDNLNTAHVQYIEARLVNLLEEANRSVMDNKQTPQEPSLSDADKADAELYLRDMLLCLPIAGVNFFEKLSTPEENESILQLLLNAKGIVGKGHQGVSEFVVFADSQAVKEEVDSIPFQIAKLREELKTQGIMIEEESFYRFTQSYIFNSPSAAAGVLLGASTNGRDYWKDEETGQTLNEMQNEELNTD